MVFSRPDDTQITGNTNTTLQSNGSPLVFSSHVWNIDHPIKQPYIFRCVDIQLTKYSSMHLISTLILHHEQYNNYRIWYVSILNELKMEVKPLE